MPNQELPQENLKQAEALKAFQTLVANKTKFIGKELTVKGDGNPGGPTKKKIEDIQLWDDAMQIFIENEPGREYTIPSLGAKVSISEDGFSISNDDPMLCTFSC